MKAGGQREPLRGLKPPGEQWVGRGVVGAGIALVQPPPLLATKPPIRRCHSNRNKVVEPKSPVQLRLPFLLPLEPQLSVAATMVRIDWEHDRGGL